MNASTVKELESLFWQRSDYCYLRVTTDGILISLRLGASRFEFDMDRGNEQDLNECLRCLGYQASEHGDLTWYDATLLAAWIRDVFYRSGNCGCS